MSSLFFDCPHCNMILKKNAIFCPICGSDRQTGWSDNAEFALPILEEEEPNYILREWFMRIISFFLIVAMVLVYF